LHVHEQVSLEDVLALLILLGTLVRAIVFPPERGPAFAAVDVTDGVVPSGHRPVTGLAFDDVDNSIKKVGSAVLAVKGTRYHGVDSSQMSSAGQAPVDTLSRKISTITHTHLE